MNARRHPYACSRASGFTLIELLVVVVIVGVLAAAIVIAVGGGSERVLANTVERFHALIAHACSQAELTGREFGVAVAQDGYTFQRLDGNQWRALGNEGELRARRWPEGLRLEFTRAGRPLELATPENNAPQLVCFSSGELTPFALVMTLGDSRTRYRVSGTEDGTLDHARIEASP